MDYTTYVCVHQLCMGVPDMLYVKYFFDSAKHIEMTHSLLLLLPESDSNNLLTQLWEFLDNTIKKKDYKWSEMVLLHKYV